MVALEKTIEHLLEHTPIPPGAEIRICSDSKSSLEKLKRGAARQTCWTGDRIWCKLNRLQLDRSSTITLHWVPGHAGIPGNEEADQLAGEATLLPQEEVPITFESASARVRAAAQTYFQTSKIRNDIVRDHRHTRMFGRGWPTMGDKLGLSRRESVEVAQLRTGHSMQLAQHRRRINRPGESGICDACRAAPEDVEHFMVRCPAKVAARMDVYGKATVTLTESLQDAHLVVAYLRRLGRL
jgi:hypothetical protein